MKKQIYCLFICVLVFGTAAGASELNIGSAHEAVELGLKRNPEFQAQLDLLESKKMLPQKLGGLSDPKVGIRLNGTPAKNMDYSFDQKRVFINQSFPFIGELGRKKQLAEKEIELSRLDLELIHNNIRLQIQTIYFDLVLNESLTKIAQKNKQIFENIINIADIKYRSGKTLQANVLKARVSKGRVDEQLLQLSHQKVKLTEELKKWMGVTSDTTLNVTLKYPEEFHLVVTDASKSTISNALWVKKAQIIEDKADKMVAIEKDRYLPDFVAQIELWDNAGMDNQYAGQLAMSIPWFNGKNHASVKEAEAIKQSKNESKNDVVNTISQRLTTGLSDLKTTLETITLYEETILKNAQLSLSSFQKAFEVDKASFLDYFESENTLYDLEIQHAKLLNKKHVLHAQINALFAKGGAK